MYQGRLTLEVAVPRCGRIKGSLPDAAHIACRACPPQSSSLLPRMSVDLDPDTAAWNPPATRPSAHTQRLSSLKIPGVCTSVRLTDDRQTHRPNPFKICAALTQPYDDTVAGGFSSVMPGLNLGMSHLSHLPHAQGTHSGTGGRVAPSPTCAVRGR